MEFEQLQMMVSDLENRIRELEHDVNSNGQNSQLQPFVPIPQLYLENPGRFDIESNIDGAVKFRNPYYDADCKTFLSTSDTVTVSADGFTFVALQISKGAGGLPSAALVTYASFEAMAAAQRDFSKAVVPLYKFDKGAVECDFRTGPQVHAWEFSG